MSCDPHKKGFEAHHGVHAGHDALGCVAQPEDRQVGVREFDPFHSKPDYPPKACADDERRDKDPGCSQTQLALSTLLSSPGSLIPKVMIVRAPLMSRAMAIGQMTEAISLGCATQSGLVLSSRHSAKS